MARPKSGDKPRDIRNAAVAEVAAVGSTAVSVNRIADRAGLSVGTIYRYYRTKEALLVAAFLQIKQDIHDAMMTAAEPHVGAVKRLQAMWFALVSYGLAAPQDFQLVEMMSAEVRPVFQDNPELHQIQADVFAEIQSGIDDQVLIDAPVRTIETVLASPAITLVRRASLSGEKPSDEEVAEIFRLIWRGVSR